MVSGSRLLIIGLCISAGIIQTAAAEPCETCTKGTGQEQDILGTVLLSVPQTSTIDQGESVSVKVTGFKRGARNPIPPNPKVTFKFTGVPSWATTKDSTVTVSATAPADATATITAQATATVGAQIVASGSIFVILNVRGLNHLDVTTAGGSAEGQERVFFTPCGMPDVRVNLLIGAGISGSLGVEVRNLPDGVTATTPKTVGVGARAVPIDIHFKTTRASGPDGKFDVVVTPAKGPPSTLKVPYKLAVGHIDDVSPNLAMTPRFMKPGDTVTLGGQGFCAGTKVTVGNSDATVDGKEGASGLQLKFVVPIDATSGDLTVKTTNGTFTAGIRIDSYRNIYGFSFGNSGAFQDMVGNYNIGDFPWGFDFWDPLYLAIADAALQSGQCFGFALTSLRFNAGEISTNSYAGWDGKSPSAPGPADDVWRVRGPLLESGGSTVPAIAEKIHRQHLWQLEGHVLGKFIDQHPTHDNLRGLLKSAFSEGPGAVVSIFEWSKGTGHAVVAYDVRDTNDAGPGGFEIDVNDPNVAFENAGNMSVFKAKGVDEDKSASDHAKRLKASRILVKSDDTYTFDDGGKEVYSGATKHDLTVLSLKVFDQDPDAPDTALIHEIFGGAAGAKVTQVTDASGKTLMGADGTPNRDPATSLKRGRMLLPAGGLDRPVDPWFVVDSKSAYTFTIANGTGAMYTAAAVTDGFALDLTKTPSQKGAIDTVVFDPTSGTAEVGSSVAKSFAPRLGARLADKTWREATVHASLAANARARLAFDAKRTTLVYTHTGASTNVSFDLGWSKRKGATVTSAPVQVENGDVVTIKPDWDHVEAGAGELRVRKAGGAETVHKIK